MFVELSFYAFFLMFFLFAIMVYHKMKKNFYILFLFFAACSFAFPVTGYSTTDIKIGVLDLSRVFEHYEKRKALDKKLKDTESDYESMIRDKQDEIMKLKDDVALLDMGTDSRSKKEDSIQRKSIELEVYAKFAEQNLLKKYKDYFEGIYIDVSNAVIQFGRKNGYDLILKNEEPELESNEITDLQFKIGIKSVLYYSNKVDITSRIIENLNNNFRGSIDD